MIHVRVMCESLDSKRESLCVIGLDCLWMTKELQQSQKQLETDDHHCPHIPPDSFVSGWKRDFDSLKTTKASDIGLAVSRRRSADNRKVSSHATGLSSRWIAKGEIK